MPSVVPSKQTVDIPVIDISPTNPDAARHILDAACEFGFVYVENNQTAGMPPADVSRMFEMVGLPVYISNRPTSVTINDVDIGSMVLC